MSKQFFFFFYTESDIAFVTLRSAETSFAKGVFSSVCETNAMVHAIIADL